MGKLITTIMAIAILGYLGYRSMYGRMPGSNVDETPKQRLDNVQKAANRIEDEQAKRAEEALKKAQPAE